MIYQRTFKAIDRLIPVVGDLIRFTGTGDYINIVHELTVTNKGLLVASTRFLKVNGGKPILLNGTRARRFIWRHANTPNCWRYWEIVVEYILVPDDRKINKLEALKNGFNVFPTRSLDDSSG
jgi:signal peptidase I